MVYDFLVEIEKIANLLVEIWEDAIINENGDIEFPNSKTEALINRIPTNNRPYTTLLEYYRFLSRVMGDKFSSEMEPFVFHVSSLINLRNIAQEELKGLLKEHKTMTIFCEENKNISVDKEALENILLAMRKEASALKVKIEVFKNTKTNIKKHKSYRFGLFEFIRAVA